MSEGLLNRKLPEIIEDMQESKGIHIEARQTVSTKEAFEVIIKLLRGAQFEIKKLKEVNALLTESNDFYSDTQNWKEGTSQYNEGTHSNVDQIDDCDLSHYDGLSNCYAGELARETKNKIKEIMEGK